MPIQSQKVAYPAFAYDSRRVGPSSVFFAFAPLPGGGSGDAHIEDAIRRGARTIVCRESPETRELENSHPLVAFVFAANPQMEFARRIALAHKEVEGRLRIIGVTGTDGKTTTCDFLYSILNLQGVRTGLLSTVGIDDGTGKRPSPYRQSTPEADTLYAFLSRCVANGLGTVVLETTSHALDPRTSRLSQLRFDGAVYTSITSEHLEFHKTLQNYVESKIGLARMTKSEGFVLSPADSPHNARIRAAFKGSAFKTYGLSSVKVVSRTLAGTVLELEDGQRIIFCYGEECFLKNAVGALEAARLATGQDIGLDVLGKIGPVAGRFETFFTKRGVFIIDFAHTEDSFKRLFSFVRSQKPQDAITAVFSSGGRRDMDKRPKLGKVAANFCSNIILSNEDPRDEGFERISADILRGVGGTDAAILLVPDRREAIRKAVELSTGNTVTLLLGKGHERTIEFENGRKEMWDERATLVSLLREARI